MEFVIHPVGFRTNAGPSTSVHHSPKGRLSPTTLTTPGMSRISRIIHKPQLLACAESSRRKNLSPSICFLYNSHTKVRCCIPLRASALHRPESLDKFHSSIRHSRALMRSASLLKSYPVRRSIAVLGRKSNRLTRTVNRPGQKISAACVSVCPRAASTCKALQLVFQAEPQSSCHLPCPPPPERQSASPRALIRHPLLCVHLGRKHPFRCVVTRQQSQFQDHQVLVSCLSSTKFQPIEHSPSHYQPFPLRCGSCMPPYAAWGLCSHRIQGILL